MRTARSWLEFITGATSLYPGYAKEKKHLKAGLIFFPLGFPMFASLGTCDFVIGKNRMSRKGRVVRLDYLEAL